MSKSKKSIYGIIGHPLDHSLSPAMHNAAFKALAVDAEYQKFVLDVEQLPDFFKSLKSADSTIFGFNVTVPYKETVLEYIDTLTPLAEKLGAVNTVVINSERKLLGYNTDAPGFMAHLTEQEFDAAGKRIVILGAGGSARAIVATLCMLPDRPRSIKIYNRTPSRMDELLNDLGSRFDTSIVEPVISIDDLNIELSDFLINTTSVGLKEADPLLIDPETLHSNMLVYDLIYNPAETSLLNLAKEKGARTSNGLGMLFYQGVLALQHWANVQLDDDVKMIMRQALEKAINK